MRRLLRVRKSGVRTEGQDWFERREAVARLAQAGQRKAALDQEREEAGKERRDALWLERKRKVGESRTQQRNRCKVCGRPRSYMRKFGLCRICFRNLALEGKIPGVVKSSW